MGSLAATGTAAQLTSLRLAHTDGARIVRMTVSWASVAPAQPPRGFDAADPSSRGYDWSAVDASVRADAAAGIAPLLMLFYAPNWAEGANPPASAQPGTWLPNAAALGQFAEAVAARYSGRFADPIDPLRMLPRVRFIEVWDEPNLDVNLAPQWSGDTAESPIVYRAMVNAVYAGVKRVERSDVIVAGATAPFGDPYPGGARIPPVTFVQDFLCLGISKRQCGEPAHFDVLDHHPYSIAGPTTPAADPGDVSIVDIHKLTTLLRQAERAGTALPRGRKPVWTTEIAWASDPPDPTGIPAQEQARYLEQSLFLLWRQGVSTVLWLQLTDQPGSSADALQTGVYFANGRPKPALQAYRFPFVTERVTGRSVLAWAIAPQAGTLRIERRSGHRWLMLVRVPVRAAEVIDPRVRIAGAATLRATVGARQSLTWSQPA